MKYFVSVTRDGRVFFNDLTAVLGAWSVSSRPNEALVSSNPQKLTTDLMQKFDPSICRDGTRVAFVAFGGVQAARFELRVKNLTSGEEKTIPTQAKSFDLLPRLSPDGSVLAYRDLISGKWCSLIVPLDDISDQEVFESFTVLDFFPDTNLALIQDKHDELERLNRRTGERELILNAGPGFIKDASLSPDGEWIAYLTGETDGRAKIWIVPLFEAPVSKLQRFLVTEDDRYLSPPEWSPNGCYLYFLSEKNDHCAIFAQELNLRTKVPVGEAREVYFSPDSRFSLNWPRGNGKIGVAEDKIIFHVCEWAGNIYLATPKIR
jgi:Tol biopolymer transport system component